MSGQRAQAHTGDHAVAAGSRAIDTFTVWIAWGDMVESIERIDSKLTHDTFMNGNVFQQGKIISKERGAEIIVSSNVAELADVGASKYARLRSVGPKGQTGSEVRPGMRSGAKRCELQRQSGGCFVGHARVRRNVCSALTVAWGKGKTAREVERCTELIASDDVVDPRRGAAEKHAVSAKR